MEIKKATIELVGMRDGMCFVNVLCGRVCVCVNVSVSIHPVSLLISARYKSIIFVFKNGHLYQCYVMWGF